MKTCSKCLKQLPLNSFPKNYGFKDGLLNRCKQCKSVIDKIFSRTLAGKQATAKAWKKYSSKPEIKNRRKELRQILRKREYKQKQLRLVFDPMYKLTCGLRRRLLSFLKHSQMKKISNFKTYIGCDKETLRKHFEIQFKEGMTWENQGEWHVHHIIPLSSAKTEEDLYKLCHYTNLQPMWALDNFKKGAK